MMTTRRMFIPLLTGAVLFIYGLNIPYISEYLMLLAAAVLFFIGIRKTENDRAFIERLALLGLFAASYYIFTTLHGITGLREAVRYFLVIMGTYILGFSVDCGKKTEVGRVLPLILLLMVGGFITFSLLSVYTFMQTSTIVDIATRIVPSFWDGSEINAPGLGANASLGMCLLTAVLFGTPQKQQRLHFFIVATIITLMFSAGVFVNIALQTRTPFLATAASLVLGMFIYIFQHKGALYGRFGKIFLVSSIVGLIIYESVARFELAGLNVFLRFSELGLESPRYEGWKTMLSSLHHSLLGGRTVHLPGNIDFVHNLWLDVIWDAGITPFIFLMVFHLKHLTCFKKVLLSELPILTLLMLAGLGTSLLANFMQEPTMAASVPYFAGSCFFLGLVLRMSRDLDSWEEVSREATDGAEKLS